MTVNQIEHQPNFYQLIIMFENFQFNAHWISREIYLLKPAFISRRFLTNVKDYWERLVPFLGTATKQSRRNRLKVFVVYFHFGHYGAPYWTLLQTFFNICSTSNLPAKLYIEYSHCYFFLAKFHLHMLCFTKAFLVFSYSMVNFTYCLVWCTARRFL